MSATVILGIVTVVALASTVVVAGFFIAHARGERKAFTEFAEKALAHIKASSPQEAAEALAVEAYQEEALREQRLQFERDFRAPKSKPDSKPAILRDASGAEYEIIQGAD